MQKETVLFTPISNSELKEILNKNKNLFQLKEIKSKPLPITGTANCNK